MVTHGATLQPNGVRYDELTVARIVWIVTSTPSSAAVEGVVYQVRQVGNPALALAAATTVKGLHQPNFSAVQSRMPGNRAGMASVYSFAADLDLQSLPSGFLSIEALAQGRDGSFTSLDTVIIENRVPQPQLPETLATLYVHAQNGSNSNAGTSSLAPVRDLHTAILRAKTIVGSNNIGNCTIFAEGDFVGGGGSTNPGSWETGPNAWLNIVGVNGCTFTRTNPPSWSLGPDDIRCGSPSANGYCRIRFRNVTVLGCGPVLVETRGDNTTTIEVWDEGCTKRARAWDGNGPRARHMDDEAEMFDIQGSQANGQDGTFRKGRYYSTGRLIQGCSIGFHNMNLVFDCEVMGHLGGNIYTAGWDRTAKAVYQSVICHDHNHSRNSTRGWGNNFQVGGSVQQLVATNNGDGTTTITGPVGGYAFGEAMADNIGSTRTFCGVYDWPGLGAASSGAGFGGTHYAVLDAGTDGSNRPYVTISASFSGTAPAGAQVETSVQTSGGPQRFNDRVHPSSLSRDDGASRTGTVIYRDIASYDVTNEVQSHFSNGEGPIRNLVIENVRDGGTGANWNMGNEDYLDCLFVNISAVSSTAVLSSGGTYTGSSMVNCVFQNGTSLSNATANGMTVDRCHFISGGAPSGATNSSTGTWLENDATVDPWSMEPTDANKGTGNANVAEPASWAFSESGSTKGALKNVALLNWEESPSLEVSARGAMPTIAVFGAAPAGEGALPAVATGAMPTIGAFGSAPQGEGAVGRYAEGAMPTVPVFGSAPTGAAETARIGSGAMPTVAAFGQAPAGSSSRAPIQLPRDRRVGGSNDGSMRSRDPGPKAPVWFAIKTPKEYRSWGTGKQPPWDKWTMR